MKKRILSFTAVLCATAMLFNVPGAYGASEQYNDANFATYKNLAENSDIPSLFKNDNVFANYKDYPPVINDGVEYVPLELFYGLSGVKISYSDDNSNFYIQNKNTNQYISFNINNSYAVTGQNKIYETEVPLFYGVQYVPLRVVCDTVNLGCSTYNDGVNKMYAIEIYTKASSLSAQELLKIYAPELYAPDSIGADNATPGVNTETSGIAQLPSGYYDENGNYIVPNTDNNQNILDTNNRYDEANNGNAGQPNDNTTQSGTNNDKNDQPVKNNDEKQKPLSKRGGTVMLFYLPDYFDDVEKSLDALDRLGVKAVFFVTEENILAHPSTVRRIYTSGHTIGITFSEINDELFAEEVLEQKIQAAENALYEVAKIKTRLLYLGEDNKNSIIPDSVRDRAESMGLHTVALNADAKTDKLNSQKTTQAIRDALNDIPESFGTNKVYLKLHHTSSAISAVRAAIDAAHENPYIHFELFDEAKRYK